MTTARKPHPDWREDGRNAWRFDAYPMHLWVLDRGRLFQWSLSHPAHDDGEFEGGNEPTLEQAQFRAEDALSAAAKSILDALDK